MKTKAVRINTFGGSDVVHLEEVPLPPLKEGEALVHVMAAGVNPVDWMVREKIFNPEGADQVPMTLGQDFSGVIEQISSAETETPLGVGDEVFGQVFGSFAEYVVVPIRDLARKPRSLDFISAAAVPMAGLTAWQAVMVMANASKGMRFLIHGAAGEVGSFAAQFAKLKGCYVAATTGRSSYQYLMSVGVDTIIIYETERFEDKVRDVDVVIDPLGGEVQARSWPLLRRGGMLINLTGEIDEAAARTHGVRGIMFGMEYDVADLEKIAELVDLGVVKPHISRVLPLDKARQALDLNQTGHSHGKIILKVA